MTQLMPRCSCGHWLYEHKPLMGACLVCDECKAVEKRTAA